MEQAVQPNPLMHEKPLRIVFLGNPEFARFHLEKIIEAGFQVVGVVSAPDKPAGRGMKLRATPVTEYARSLDIPCLQPKNLKSPDFQSKLKALEADLQVVIAFRMLPEAVWNMPPLGTYNLHASLLPAYRGAAPINWAIINGEKETGVTTFKLKHQIDTGNIILQKKCPIDETDTAGTLYDKLMILGADTMVETLTQIKNRSVKEQPQDLNTTFKEAPKLFHHNTTIDWNKTGQEIINFVRGLNPFPTAWCMLDDKEVKVDEVAFEPVDSIQVGAVYSNFKNILAFGCKDGLIKLPSLKMQGKRKMDVQDFLNGYNLSHLEVKAL
jgi:methionyl-tRNA formyltransferase